MTSPRPRALLLAALCLPLAACTTPDPSGDGRDTADQTTDSGDSDIDTADTDTADTDTADTDTADTDTADTDTADTDTADTDTQDSGETQGPPTVEGVRISPDGGRVGDTLTCAATARDAHGATLAPTFAWTNEATGAPLGAASTYVVTAADTTPGDVLTCTASVVDAGGSASAADDALVVDSDPVVTMVTISPPAPLNDDTVSCVGAAEDADLDVLDGTYAWTNDTRRTSLGADASLSLSAAVASPSDILTCTYAAQDPYGGVGVGSTRVTIGNRLPVLDVPVLTPAVVATDDVVTTSEVATDDDGDTVTVRWAWYVDGVLDRGATGASLDGGTAFAKNQSIQAVGTPNDGHADGASVASASLVVVNTAPVTTVAISPAYPVVGRDDLLCGAIATDADGDVSSLTVAWTVNGVPYADATTSVITGDTIPAAVTTVDDVWTCTVTADDGEAAGLAGSDAVIVGEPPVPVVISAGVTHSAVVLSDGTVWDWGDNDYGQLGDGTTTERDTPVQVSGITNAVDVAAGYFYTVALLADGTVWAWGDNNYGELGDGTRTNRTRPVQVSGLSGVVEMSGGWQHTLVRLSDDTVWAWGNNANGQLGDATSSYRTIAAPVSTMVDTAHVYAGCFHSFAVLNDGTAWAWGRNNHNQVAPGTATSEPNPVELTGLGEVASFAGGVDHSVALLSDGSVWTWGSNQSGAIGDGTNTSSETPIEVGITDVVDISASHHTFAVKSDGTLWGWGRNWYGQLGNGTETDGLLPEQVGALDVVLADAGRSSHSLALLSDGTLWAWGSNDHGELGDGTTTEQWSPVEVVGF